MANPVVDYVALAIGVVQVALAIAAAVFGGRYISKQLKTA